jgi:hypothetical protein
MAITAPRKALQQVVMKVETAYGEDALGGVYVLTDVIQAVTDSVRFTPQIEEIPNLATAGALGRMPSGIGQRLGTIAFDLLIRGIEDPAGYDATKFPEADLPLRGCGLGSSIVEGAGRLYVPTDNHESLTIYVVQAIPGGASARAAEVVGCMGNVRATMRAAGTGRFQFSFQGTLNGFFDIPYVPAALKPLPALPTLREAGLLLGAWGPCVDTLDFDMGNQLRRVPCANAVSGSSGFMIANREPVVGADPNMDLEAVTGLWDSLEDADPLLAVGWTLGQKPGNKVSWHVAADDSPGGQIIQDEWSDRDGVSVDRLRIRATLREGPNTDFAILFS